MIPLTIDQSEESIVTTDQSQLTCVLLCLLRVPCAGLEPPPGEAGDLCTLGEEGGRHLHLPHHLQGGHLQLCYLISKLVDI